MKISKKAEQENVLVNESFYSTYELAEMREKPYMFTLHELFRQYGIDESLVVPEDENLRISLSYAKELKVILAYGHYETVCIMQDGSQYYVKL